MYHVSISLLGIIFGLVFSPYARSQDSQRLEPFARDEVDDAIDKGIDFLISCQRSDGAILDRSQETTMTSLAIMALASIGVQTQDVGPRGEAMRKSLAFVLRDDRVDPNGYFGQRDGSRMYGHGITTLMLTEMVGMGVDVEQDERIAVRCRQAIDVILSAQRVPKSSANRGGWRYEPGSGDSDLSVSVWQLMALRSAKNDGFEVPASSIQQAVDYLKRSYTATLDEQGNPPERENGFSYTPQSNHPTYTMTAAGLLAMQVCGEYQSPLVRLSANWLLKHPPKPNERFFYYGTYYYAQGMYQREGEAAATAERLVRETLLPLQKGNGAWEGTQGEESGLGAVYATSLAILSLSVKFHYLPIYQR
jgi:hypothetical protein